MALTAKYHAFLGAPAAAALSPHASINYIPTLTTVNEPDAILKHLSAQGRVLTKKGEKILSAIESSDGLCLDVETTLEFVSGGGAFLPGLDDNFLADRTVIFPVVHIVRFDDQQRIRTVRLYWDQASLLKQVEIIGSRARNWPIRDGKDQARLIASSASVSQPGSNAGDGNGVNINRPQTGRSSVSATGDPHASLSLFQPRDVNQENSHVPVGSFTPRATSAKPPSRDLHEILGHENDATSMSSMRSPSPSKAGAGKNYHPIRLFDQDVEEESSAKSPQHKKADPKKYDHFQFGDGEDATPKAARDAPSLKAKKHTNQWDFEDFATPEKVASKTDARSVRHFGWSDDEDAEQSPVKRPVVHQPRPDAQKHFELKDDGSPAAEHAKNIGKGRQHNNGLGLYKDHVVDNEHDVDSSKNGPLSNVTKAVNNSSRHKDFGSQFEMADSSPGAAHVSHPVNENSAVPETKKKVLKGLDANWDLYEQPSGVAPSKDTPKERGINIGGDGMGGSKGSDRAWIFGDDAPDAKPEAKAATGRKGSARVQNQPTQKGFWDF